MIEIKIAKARTVSNETYTAPFIKCTQGKTCMALVYKRVEDWYI